MEQNDTERLVELISKDYIPEIDRDTKHFVMQLMIKFGHDGEWIADTEEVLAEASAFQDMIYRESKDRCHLDIDTQFEVLNRMLWLRVNYKKILMR